MRGTEKSREIEFTYEKLKSESSFPSFCLQFSSIGQIIRENSFQQKEKETQTKIWTQSAQIGGLWTTWPSAQDVKSSSLTKGYNAEEISQFYLILPLWRISNSTKIQFQEKERGNVKLT